MFWRLTVRRSVEVLKPEDLVVPRPPAIARGALGKPWQILPYLATGHRPGPESALFRAHHPHQVRQLDRPPV